jgi:anti-anti-sigma factor
MSTFVDELRISSPATHPVPGGPSRRPARPVGWAPTQSRVRTTAPLGRPQTLLLVGELDAATAVLGRRQLRGALEIGRGPLVLDCSSVRFIDAAWLGVLVSSARYARQLGRKVTVAAPSPRVLRVLRLVGLEWLMGDQ